MYFPGWTAFFFLPSDLSKMYHYHWDHDNLQCTTWLPQILLIYKCKEQALSSIPQVTNEDTEQTRLRRDASGIVSTTGSNSSTL